MSRTTNSLLFCLLAVVPLSLVAAVDSVLVFPDRATVTRVHAEDIGSGSGVLVIEDLPIGLDRDSLRVSARGPDGLTLGAIELSTVRGSERVNPQARELGEQIRELEDRRAAIEDDIQAREMQLALLRSLSEPSGDASTADAAVLLENMQRFGQQADEVLSARRDLLGEKRTLDEQIEQLNRRLADLGKTQQDTTGLRLDYTAGRSGQARFEIEYTVGGAGWRPVYEWRLDTTDETLELVQTAEVRQSTGENWADAALSLSLSRPSSGGRLPELQPWWIDVVQPRPEPAPRAKARESMAESLDRVQVTGSQISPADYYAAELAGTALTRRYDVGGRASVASNNQPHRFRLDQQTIDVALTARSAPRRQPAAWTFIEGTWTGDAALPPGNVTLFQDGTLTGRTGFSGAAPGSEIEASFGVDDNIEIEYELTDEERSTEGLLSKSTRETRNYRIVVTNRHNRPARVTLFDQLPVSRDERIEVSLADGSTPPDRRDIEDRPGIVAWDLDLDAGQRREIEFGYSVRYPQDIEGVQGW